MELNILYVNDVHGYLELHEELFYTNKSGYTASVGGYARIATLAKEINENNNHTLFFDGGDTFHGTQPVVKSKGEAVIPVLNKLGLNAMVGHWDFGYGPNQLKYLLSKLNYPMLAINVYNDDGSLFLPPFIKLQVEDVKVGVIGICNNIIDKTMPERFSRGLNVTSGINELPQYIQQLKDEDVDVIILLSHNGFPQDIKILKEVDGVDICLSAHTHNRLYKPVEVNNTIVIQCGCHGSFLGHLKLSIENKKIISHQYDLIKIEESIPPNSEMEEIINNIVEPYKASKSNKIGSSESLLHRYDTLNSSMDSLLLDAIKYASDTQIAFSNGWRYGAPINNGEITEDDLWNIVPVNPPISTTELTGKEIVDMLEENLERTFSCDPMGQMGGDM